MNKLLRVVCSSPWYQGFEHSVHVQTYSFSPLKSLWLAVVLLYYYRLYYYYVCFIKFKNKPTKCIEPQFRALIVIRLWLGIFLLIPMNSILKLDASFCLRSLIIIYTCSPGVSLFLTPHTSSCFSISAHSKNASKKKCCVRKSRYTTHEQKTVYAYANFRSITTLVTLGHQKRLEVGC